MKISYIQSGDYLIPNITLETAGHLGKYGRMRLRFLKEHHPVTFNGWRHPANCLSIWKKQTASPVSVSTRLQRI